MLLLAYPTNIVDKLHIVYVSESIHKQPKYTLKSIELKGFKTFAEYTILHPAQGITAIVGPNGAGKSNIVDAILWVLGCSSPKVLRVENMENLIYNGGDHRAALRVAEVTINFARTDGEGESLSISRRIEKGEEARYYINGHPTTRRKALQVLGNSDIVSAEYAVTCYQDLQELVEYIDSGLSRMIQKASGIEQLQSDRQTALKRLQNVEISVSMLAQQIAILEEEVANLERHAEKARKAANLKRHIEELEREIKLSQVATDIRTLNELTQQYEILQRNLHDTHAKLEQINADIRSILKHNEYLANHIEKLRQEITDAYISREREQGMLALIEQSISHLSNQKEMLKEQLDQLVAHRSTSDQQLEELLVITQNLKDQLNGLESLMSVPEPIKPPERQELDELLKHLENIKAQAVQIEEKVVRHRHVIESAETQMTELDIRIQHTDSEHYICRQELETKRAQLLDAKKALDSLERETQVTQTIMENLQREQAQLTETHTELSKKISDLQSRKHEVELLLTQASWLHDVEKQRQTLLDLIHPEPGYEKAAEALFLRYIHCSVYHDIDQLLNDLATYPKDKQFAALLLPSQPNNGSDSIIKDERKLISHITAPKALIDILPSHLKNAEIVESVKQALSSESKEHEVFVTLDGTVVQGKFIFTITPRKHSLFKLKAKLSGIINDLSHVQSEQQQLASQIEKARNQQQTALTQYRKLLSESSSLQERIRQLNRDVGQLEAKLSQLDQLRTTYQKTKLETEQLLSQTTMELNNLEVELSRIRATKERLEQEVQEKENRYRSELQQFSQAVAEQSRLAEQKKHIEQQLMNYENMISSLTQQRNENDATISAVMTRMDELQKQIDESLPRLAELRQILEKLNHIITTKQDELKNMEDQINAAKDVMSMLDTQRISLVSKHSSYEAKIQSCQSSINQIKSRVKDVEFNDSEIASYQSPANREELEQRLKRYREQLSRLGAVNEAAEQQLNIYRNKLDLISSQLNELVNAKLKLIETLKLIEKIEQQKYQAAVTEIQKILPEIFSKISGGGNLSVKVDSENYNRITIEVKPMKKAPRALSSLSSGEISMVALSILLSIQQISGMPFMVLDEVDAALDESNLERFISAIKELGKSKKIIMITHNVKTMAAADSIYGVYLTKDGTTEIINAELEELVGSRSK